MRTKTVDRRRHIGIGMLCAAILLIGAKLLQDFRRGARQHEEADSGEYAGGAVSAQRRGGRGTVHTFDPVCFSAFAQMMARPDPADLPRRAYVYRYEGEPNRRVTRLPGIIMGWLQRRHLEVDADEPLARATRAPWKRHGRPVNPGLRVLRPAASG